MIEETGTITVRITTGADYMVGTPSTALVTVLDNDTPVARISADPSPITEGTAATFTVALDMAAPVGGLTISVDVTESGSYIAGSAPETVFITAGATTGTLAVMTEDDAIGEDSGTITVRLITRAGYTVADAPDHQATVTILDNDFPAASITADASSITEGTTVTFTVALNRPAPAGGLTIGVGVAQSGSYIRRTTPMTFTIPIAEGATTGTQRVETEDDSADEADGSITATINEGAGYMVAAADNQAAVTVLDNDVLLASITADSTPITEGTDATFRVTLGSAAPAGGLTVSVAVTQSGSYISGLAPTEVVIVAGATTGTLTVSTDDDEVIEPPGSITAVINADTGYTVGTTSTAIVTVNDNDDPVVSITSISPSVITEGTDATFRLALDREAPAGGLTVSVRVQDAGNKIAGSLSATVFIAAGATTGTLTLRTDDDEMTETDSFIIVFITMGTDYTVAAPPDSAAEVLIEDNDARVVSISAGPSPITEGTDATFTVTLDRAALAGGLTIQVGVTESGDIIENLPSATVFIASGATTVTLEVSTDDDELIEETSIITAEITDSSTYTVADAPDHAAEVTVLDNDSPVASISAVLSPITEGERATFTVTLDRAVPTGPAGALAINVEVTESGSYIDGSIVTIGAGLQTVILEGTTTAVLSLPTVDDSMGEPIGIITVRITTGAGYTVGTTSTATVTVNDNDDPVVSISAGPTPITEGADATFTVTLDRAAPAGGLTISVAVTQSGSYIVGSPSATVFIAAEATTVTLAVSTDDDEVIEPPGLITAVITAGTDYTVGTTSTAMITVNDNDAPVASISAGPSPITEGADAIFTVALDSTAPAGGLTIGVTVTDASNDIDGPAPTEVFIAAGATTGTLTVSTDDDEVIEPPGLITAVINRGHRLHGGLHEYGHDHRQ